MDISKIIQAKKTLIIQGVILIAVVAGGYYGYTAFFVEEKTTTVTVDGSLLGPNFTEFIKATTKDKVSFKEKGFLTGDYVRQLQDFSEIILPNATRGRLDPFLPYASSRSLR